MEKNHSNWYSQEAKSSRKIQIKIPRHRNGMTPVNFRSILTWLAAENDKKRLWETCWALYIKYAALVWTCNPEQVHNRICTIREETDLYTVPTYSYDKEEAHEDPWMKGANDLLLVWKKLYGKMGKECGKSKEKDDALTRNDKYGGIRQEQHSKLSHHNSKILLKSFIITEKIGSGDLTVGVGRNGPHQSGHAGVQYCFKK